MFSIFLNLFLKIFFFFFSKLFFFFFLFFTNHFILFTFLINTLFSVISQGSYLCFYTFIFLCIFSFHRTFHKFFIKNIIFSLFSIFLNLFLKIIFSFSFSQNYFFFLFQKNWTLFFCENSYFFIFYFFKIRQKTEHFAKPSFYFFLCIEKKFNSKHEKNLLLKNFENWFLSFFYVHFLKTEHLFFSKIDFWKKLVVSFFRVYY